MSERRKVNAVFADFNNQIDALVRLDAQNQQRYRAGPGRPGAANISKNQLVFLTEGIFARAFSHFEIFFEEIFILYSRGKPTISGAKVKSYITPRNGSHARDIIKSGMNFLEWNNPEYINRRCEIYLEPSNPIKLAITTNSSRINEMRKIRNAIAHQSAEAQTMFDKVVRANLRAMPLKRMAPGEFLNQNDPLNTTTYFLLSYMQTLKGTAATAVS